MTINFQKYLFSVPGKPAELKDLDNPDWKPSLDLLDDEELEPNQNTPRRTYAGFKPMYHSCKRLHLETDEVPDLSEVNEHQ